MAREGPKVFASSAACLVGAVAVLAGGWAQAADQPLAVDPIYRVPIRNLALRAHVLWALEGAAARLQRPECLRVFSEFVDEAGATIQDRLNVLALEPHRYLEHLIFADGYATLPCQKERRLAFTAPGSPVVRICPPFLRTRALEPAEAEMLIIHEVLHALGLAEDPPSSALIRARVAARCGH